MGAGLEQRGGACGCLAQGVTDGGMVNQHRGVDGRVGFRGGQ